MKKSRLQKQSLFALCVLLGLVLSSCGFPGIVSTSEQLPAARSVAQHSLPPIRFPQDEGGHNSLTEWWYYTGHLEAIDTSGNQHRYGFELVIFQAVRSDLPPVYLSHFAISDITHSTFQYDQRSISALSSSVPDGTATNGINVHVGDWSIQGVNGRDHIIANMKNYAINLNLMGRKPAVLHNGNGVIAYGPGGSSYYYSRTRMDVAGTLLDHNQQLHITGGLAWMDHQWGNFLPLGDGGWDWYSIQLSNNTEIMLYFMRDASGALVSTYIGYIDPTAKDFILQPASLHTSVLNQWTSPITAITYPSGWQLDINDPHLQAALTLKPLLQNQELITTSTTGNVYWEGAVAIQGQSNGQPISGQGYVELTGYTKS